MSLDVPQRALSENGQLADPLGMTTSTATRIGRLTGLSDTDHLVTDEETASTEQGRDVDKAKSLHNVQRAYDRETLDVRSRAAEVLAAIGAQKLCVVALFRANRWAEASAANYESDQRLADLYCVRAAEWRRIGWAFSLTS